MKNSQKGLSLIELVVAVAIFSIAFFGLFGVLNSSMAVIAKNKARLGAMALVEEQIEYARSLPFAGVGTVNGNPVGILPQTETISLNGITYARRNAIFWIDDPSDGTALLGTDPISTDYKRIKVEVSWNFRGTVSSYSASSNITPKGKETNVPGGIFNFTVFDYLNNNVSGAKINIYKAGVVNTDRYTDTLGKWYEMGVPPGTGYQITVTKLGYSTSSTYAVSAGLPDPDPRTLESIDDRVNPLSFQIDKLSSKEVKAYSPPINESWEDLFSDTNNLSDLSSLVVSGGELILSGEGNYDLLGTAHSTEVTPANLYQWTQFSWNDTKPAGTELLYKIYYTSSGVTHLIPDTDLHGNSVGFTSSPVDLSGLNTDQIGTTPYLNLSIGITATTNDPLVTPSVQDWKLAYKRHIPKANFTFHMRGAKTIGQDASGYFVYKYDKDITTNSLGYVTINPLEWDTYEITANGFDVSESCPPQPNLITPGNLSTVFMDFVAHTAHSLLVRVVNNAGVEQTNALVRLYRDSPSYDSEKKVGQRCAQAFWSNLSEGMSSEGLGYSLGVSVFPHTSTTTVTGINVFGASKITVPLN
ncbi:type II secretion system protein [bacterium]|nr:MAG: type II secretion system protein [bacterium]